ncbi:universal stress protein [Halalkalicoccus jeotgali]|nr:universal stress protein [Halalkalicoccus jeotgali]
MPLDGSDEAAHAARWGLELDRQFDATADVVHVVE